MNKIYLLIFTSIFFSYLNAQDLKVEWIKTLGSSGLDEGININTDIFDNVYITGNFEQTVDFDPSSDILNLTSNGNLDIFIQKLGSEGELLWAKSFGGIKYDNAKSITSDILGNVYVTGFFQDTVDFDPSANVFNLNTNGGSDIFVLKLDVDGNLIWAKSFGGVGFDSGNSLTLDNLGNIYITGFFSETVDFDPGPENTFITSNGFKDLFIQKMDTEGNLLWIKSVGGINDIKGLGIATDATDNVCIAGVFRGIVDFDPGSGITDLDSNNNEAIFVQKLDVNGDFEWAKSMSALGSSDYAFPESILVDDMGNVYTTGVFSGTIDFDPGSDVKNLQQYGVADAYVQKLDTFGNLLWAKSMGGFGFDSGKSLAIDGNGNLFTTGIFSQTVYFDSDDSIDNLISNGGYDIYFQKLDPSGDILWVKSIGGQTNDVAYSMTSDSKGDLLYTGSFYGTVDFNPSTNDFNLTSNGGADIFVLKLSDTNTLKIVESQLLNNVQLFPNPTKDQATLSFGNLNNLTIEVYNSFGQKILEAYNINDSSYDLNFKGVSGVYFVQITLYKTKKTFKLIKY